MKMIMMPGYRSLFGEPTSSYEEILTEVPSEIIIMLLIALNAELNTSEAHTEKQNRIWQLVSYRFTKEQQQKFKIAFSKYNVITNGFDGTLFDRSCLLAMIIKELKRNNTIHSELDEPTQEYNFVLAYLLVVDEVRKEDSEFLENAKKYKDEVMPTLPLLWAGGIRQYEFNHTVNIAYELFKLICFSKYAYLNFRPYLKELLSKYSFKNLSQFIGSFNQIMNVTLIDDEKEPLRKLVSINPSQLVDLSHLKALCCYLLIGKNKIAIADLRKYPLYETSIRGFMIIDEDMIRKKIYKGPLFELQKETQLNAIINFEDYKTKVSKDFFENVFFRSIAKIMVKSKYENFHFDDNVLGKPDLFYRSNKSVILIEFKDYLFPDKIMVGNDFASFKKYIDERFIISDKQKPKGVEQLANNIDSLYKMDYDFDFALVDIIAKKRPLKIYPIICHTDFMFSMPGINQYLNIVFAKKLKEKNVEAKYVRNVTLISLEILFDFAMRGQNFISLAKLIERYWTIIDNRKKRIGSVNSFLASNVSFDEMYETKFKKELLDNHHLSKEDKLAQFSEAAGLTQEQLKEVL